MRLSSLKPSVPSLSAHLGYWLRFVSNHVSYAFARKLADKDVTVAEWAVLHALYAERVVGPSRLAKRLGLSRGAISKLADRLIQKTLIVREDSAQDLRTHTLTLTRAGAQARRWSRSLPRSPTRMMPSSLAD